MLLVRNNIGGCTKYFESKLICFSFTKYLKWLILSLEHHLHTDTCSYLPSCTYECVISG